MCLNRRADRRYERREKMDGRRRLSRSFEGRTGKEIEERHTTTTEYYARLYYWHYHMYQSFCLVGNLALANGMGHLDLT